jgi:hypothetical protein
MTAGLGDVAGPADLAVTPRRPSAAARRSRNGRYGRWLILTVAGIYFLGPLIAAIAFTLKDDQGGITFTA